MISTRSEHTPKITTSAETCHENSASMPHPETQIPMARPHPTPQKHDSPNANPNGTAQQTADITKRCSCAVKSSSTLQHLTFPYDSSLFHTNLTRHVSIRNLLQKLPPMASSLRRDDDDKRRQTTTDDDRRRHDASHANTAPTPRPPTINGNPSLRIREKHVWYTYSAPMCSLCQGMLLIGNINVTRSARPARPR